MPHVRRPLPARLVAVLLLAMASVAGAREKDVLAYGEGLIINVPLPFEEVVKAVEDVAANGIIQGTKEYNKDEYVKGATGEVSSPIFGPWKDTGKTFYKVRKQVLSPWNFKDSSDIGTLAVRYVVQPQGEKNTLLQINALFVEDNRHRIHQSNGSVESSEYKDIQDHLAAAELLKKETAEALKAKEEHQQKKNFGLSNDTELLSTPRGLGESSSREGDSASSEAMDSAPVSIGQTSSADPHETPEQHLAALRQLVEKVVKKPGAPLKSAPFHSANTLKSLGPGTEVMVVIVSPYWLGVETHEGEHGWVKRDQLEPVP